MCSVAYSVCSLSKPRDPPRGVIEFLRAPAENGDRLPAALPGVGNVGEILHPDGMHYYGRTKKGGSLGIVIDVDEISNQFQEKNHDITDCVWRSKKVWFAGVERGDFGYPYSSLAMHGIRSRRKLNAGNGETLPSTRRDPPYREISAAFPVFAVKRGGIGVGFRRSTRPARQFP